MTDIRRAAMVLLAFALATPAATSAQDSGQPLRRSLRDGVFTQRQVDRGATVFHEVCLECHESIEFVESGYLKSWEGEPVFELYDYVSTMMPESNPGSLRPRQYLAVLAYIFRLNGLPVGETPLDDDEGFLKNIIIEGPEGSLPHGRSPQ